MKKIKIGTILVTSTILSLSLIESAWCDVAFITGGSKPIFEGKKLSTSFTCPANFGWHMGECKPKCDEKVYLLAGEPDLAIGEAETCESVFGNRFIYTSCHDGWTLADGKCIENTCEGFIPVTTEKPSDLVGTFESCKSGHTLKFKYSSCNEGWDFNNNECIIHNCDAATYPYTTKPSEAAGTVIECKTGVTTRYGYTDCTADYTFNEGKCIGKCTLSETALPANCEQATDSCSRDDTVYYSAKCKVCQSGYAPQKGVCKSLIKACEKGDIYYSDDTCSSEYISGKEAIGIYAWNNFVISLKESKKSWGEAGKDIPELENSMSGFGIANTEVLASHNSSAAKYCAEMTDGGKKWFLPSIDELNTYIGFANYLNDTAAKIPNAQSFLSTNKSPKCYHYYWSSSEADANNAEAMFPCGSLESRQMKKDNALYVRCMFSVDDQYNNPETPEFIDCTDAKVGDYYYKNGKCSSTFTKTTDIYGVIYDAKNHLVVDFETNSDTMFLGEKFSEGILIDNVVDTDVNGAKHTKAIVEYSQWAKDNIPGASYYVTSARRCYDKGNNWFLPTPKQMEQMYTNKDIINASLKKAGGSILGDVFRTYGCQGYWSSLMKYQKGYVYDMMSGKVSNISTNINCPAKCVKSYLPLVRHNGTPIGVIFYEDSSVQKVVALNNAGSGIWGDGNGGYDVDTLPNLITDNQMQDDMDGQANTDKIITYFNNKGVTSGVAALARNYAPSACEEGSFCGKGKWYLPSSGELQLINDEFNDILLAGSHIGMGWTASSTEAVYSENNPDLIDFGCIRLGYADSLTRCGQSKTTRQVVPVLEIKK